MVFLLSDCWIFFQRVRCEVWPPLFCCERDSDPPFPCVCPGLLLRRRLQVPFPTGDLLVAGADLFLLSFALQGWLCAFIGFKVPRTFRGAGFCSSCQAFGVLQCSGRRIFSGHRFSCWWWRMVLSLFFFVDGMVDVLSVASVRRGSATATALATYPRLWGSMARRTVDLDGFRRAGVAGVQEDGGSS